MALSASAGGVRLTLPPLPLTGCTITDSTTIPSPVGRKTLRRDAWSVSLAPVKPDQVTLTVNVHPLTERLLTLIVPGSGAASAFPAVAAHAKAQRLQRSFLAMARPATVARAMV